MTCPDCGSEKIRRDIEEGTSAASSAHRDVGGQNRHVVRLCANCGYRYGRSTGG